MKKLTEERIVQLIEEYTTVEKKIGNWDKEKTEKTDLHEHGVDLKLVGGKRHSERFFIECKGKSYAKSAKSINKEGWIVALGQLITRMDTKRLTKSKDGTINGINRAYKYRLGLYWESAQVALRRIPKEAAEVLNLHIFAVTDNGKITYFTPNKFGKEYTNDIFL